MFENVRVEQNSHWKGIKYDQTIESKHLASV